MPRSMAGKNYDIIMAVMTTLKKAECLSNTCIDQCSLQEVGFHDYSCSSFTMCKDPLNDAVNGFISLYIHEDLMITVWKLLECHICALTAKKKPFDCLHTIPLKLQQRMSQLQSESCSRP